jgi:DNA (cytosine-5)-methyltransferase 1
MGKNNWGGYRKGAGRLPLDEKEKKKGAKIYINDYLREDIEKYGKGKSFSDKTVDLITSEINNRKYKSKKEI